MRGRLHLSSIVFSAMSLLAVATAAARLADGSSVLVGVGLPLVLMATTWLSVVIELGRRRGGRIPRRWVISVIGLTVIAVVVNIAGLAAAGQGVLRTTSSVALSVIAVALTIGVIIENSHDRLGLPRSRRRRVSG